MILLAVARGSAAGASWIPSSVMECSGTVRCLSLAALADCTLCPRECHVNRTRDELGYCRTGNGFSLGAICVHRGEEPLIAGPHGICNVFFTRCNLQCRFCQNAQISRNRDPIYERSLGLDEVVRRIESVLDRGPSAVGFVSPSHVVPQMVAIIDDLRRRGRGPTFVMNTGAYDKTEVLRALEGRIDVYLPDLKYMDADLARRLSDASDYPRVAATALKEMYRQVGSEIAVDVDGNLRSGLVVRHLVLPGCVDDSKACLRFLARELSPRIHLSLLAQYCPTPLVAKDPLLGRRLRQDEYDQVVAEAERLGFERGWVQALDSAESYLPDFARDHPFEGD
jgi:putative pyruvate formate lyase activating enzyme